jgi:type III pantothenate kinase
VLGLFSESDLVCHWRAATDKTSTSDELRVKLRDLLSLADFTVDDVTDAVLSSVVPELTALWRRVFQAHDIPCLSIGAHLKKNFGVKYPTPNEIGADRVADAAAAVAKYGAPAIVVDLGTATNMEVIDRDGDFVGGIIAPGFITGSEALFDAAARIPRFDLKAPRRVIGDSTKHAVQSGILYGEVARIDGLVRMVFFELGYEATVIATGGLASSIAPLSSVIDVVDEGLTLEGGRILFELNQEDPDDDTVSGAVHASDIDNSKPMRDEDTHDGK